MKKGAYSMWTVPSLFERWSYLDVRDPEQANVEDTISYESCQVQRQEVKVETYNTEHKKCKVRVT